MTTSKRLASPPNPGGDAGQSRKRRLEGVNAKLAELGLPPLRRLGDVREGEEEVEGIASWSGNDTIVLVIFNVIYPDGHHGQHAIVYNTKQVAYQTEREGKAVQIHIGGAICIVTLKDERGGERFVLARQHRVASEEWDPWPLDIPRGFNQGNILPIGVPILRRSAMPFALDTEDCSISEIPIGIVGRKLAPLLTSGLVTMETFTVLGISPQNNGTDRVLNLITHMGLRTQDIDRVLLVRGTDAMRIEYPTVEEVYDRWYEMGLGGGLTVAALWYYDRMIRNPKRGGAS